MDAYGGQLLQSVGAACGGVDGVAELVESACSFLADAGGCACDECSLVHAGVSLVVCNMNADSLYIVNKSSLYCKFSRLD